MADFDDDPERGYPVFGSDNSHTFQDDFALRAQRQRARQQPAGILPVYPLPLRNHAMWAGNNEIGQEVAFAPDANNRQTILKMGEWGFPEVWTIMLGIVYTPDVPDISVFNIIANISAGVGGAVQEFRVDWNSGTIIRCVMNAVVITAEYSIAASVPSDLRLRATIARGRA